VPESAISKLVVDGGGVCVEETRDVGDGFICWEPFDGRDDGMGEAFNKSFNGSCCHVGFGCGAGGALAALAEFPYKLQGEVHVPWTDKLFKVDETSKRLDDKRQETFHSFGMKAMLLCKRARSDVQPAISFLASHVQEPNEGY
jgi:hypothetical protein